MMHPITIDCQLFNLKGEEAQAVGRVGAVSLILKSIPESHFINIKEDHRR
jgi:hypothetical protein